MSEVLNYNRGYVYKNDIIYVAATIPDLEEKQVPHTIMLRYMKGKWNRWVIDHRTIGHVVLDLPKGRTVFSISNDGKVQVGDRDGFRIEIIDKTSDSPNMLRNLRSVTLIDGYLYTVGMSRMVYRRSLIKNHWERFDEGIRVKKSSKEVSGLSTIVGSNNSNIYVAGIKGQVWYFNGQSWKQVDSGTNLGLHSMTISSGEVYACGSAGIVIAGSQEKWRLVNNEVTDEAFWDIVSFRGEIYLSTEEGNLYKIHNGEVVYIDLGLNKNITTYKLHVNDSVMLSVGLRDIYIFNGEKWRDITPKN